MEHDPRLLVIRIWLPDRPGALGQIASRIGAVRGDLLAIDILERGGGQVVDELIVSLPSEVPEALLARELDAVDGVSVEMIEATTATRPDPTMALFELAAQVAEADQPIAVLGDGLRSAFDADWVCCLRHGEIVHRSGPAPSADWVAAFVEGSDHLDELDVVGNAPPDVLRVRLGRSGLTLAIGRSGRAVHERERARLRALARIVDSLIVLPV